MKTLMLGTALAVVLGSSVSAQDLFRSDVDPAAITASDFIGKRVYAVEAAVDADEYEGVQQDWNDIGEINDVILTRDGRIDSVLVDIGGFLGMGERQVAVSMESIRFVSDSATAEDMNDFFLVINADRTVLEGAPEFVRTGAVGAEGADAGAAADTATEADAGADAAVVATEGATDDTATEGTAAVATEGAMADDTAEATDDTMAEGTDAATAGEAREGYTAMDSAGLTADELMGVRVYGQNDEDVGEISDLVLDANGVPVEVIVDVGGFLGIGEKPVAIALAQLQLMQASEGGTVRAYVQMTQEELEQLPAK